MKRMVTAQLKAKNKAFCTLPLLARLYIAKQKKVAFCSMSPAAATVSCIASLSKTQSRNFCNAFHNVFWTFIAHFSLIFAHFHWFCSLFYWFYLDFTLNFAFWPSRASLRTSAGSQSPPNLALKRSRSSKFCHFWPFSRFLKILDFDIDLDRGGVGVVRI